MNCCKSNSKKADAWFTASIQNDVLALKTLSSKFAGTIDSSNKDTRRHGLCALHYAILNRNLDSISFLLPLEAHLKTGSRIDFSDLTLGVGANIVHLSLFIGDFSSIQCVLDYSNTVNTDFHTITADNQTCLQLLTIKATKQTITFIQHDFFRQEIARELTSSLIRAVQFKNQIVFQYLLQQYDQLSDSFVVWIRKFLVQFELIQNKVDGTILKEVQKLEEKHRSTK
ncbi:Ankyrin_repeat-containing protein [Hexamita inflata]|uniref:Ankyrin repeat-containing protein n=1 Tax=Hexamita inflata TaxID=28002 RepID=A0AA86PW24_9EUKA|nr:Ankyrin repeat-containing protein [Hexamita inflata]